MNKKNLILLISIISLMIFLVGCSKKKQLENLVDPTGEHALNTWMPEWVLYDNEVKTGGGIAKYTSDNGQSLDISYDDGDNNKCIRYYWNGDEVYDFDKKINRVDFCGFAFSTTEDVITHTGTFSERNISGGEYNTLSFSLKGELSDLTSVVIEGPKDSDSNYDGMEFNKDTITNDWKEYSFSLRSADLSKIKSFVDIVFIYKGNANTKGSGGTVYVDNIKLLRK
jgi:hypothetical protein